MKLPSRALGCRAMVLRNKFRNMFRISSLEHTSDASQSDYG
jgi:hypothetical protein